MKPRPVWYYSPAQRALVPWCSGPTCVPVKDEIAGSNPVGTAKSLFCRNAVRSTRPAAFLLFSDTICPMVQSGNELAVRALPSEAMQLAARLAKALESYLQANGGAAPRTQVLGVVRAWVPRWDNAVPPLLADALVEGLVRQGKVVATRHHVGLVEAVDRWRVRFAKYPQRLTQPAEQVARDCDLPVSAVISLRALVR